MKYYNLQQTRKDYYGKGDHFIGFFISNRYGRIKTTCNQGSAWLFSFEEAQVMLKEFFWQEDRDDWSMVDRDDWSIVECPESVKQDLRCLFA